MSATGHRMGSMLRTGMLLALVGLGSGLGGCGGDDEGEILVPPGGNKPPTVELVVVGTTLRAFASADSVLLRSSAADADDDSLTITWSLTVGSAGRLREVGDPPREAMWTAGATVGRDTVVVTVSDGNATVEDRIALTTGTLVTPSLLSSGTPWTGAASPYLVRGDVTVGASRILELEAGVEVWFQGALNDGVLQKPLFTIRGRLEANGVPGNRVVFTGGHDFSGPQFPDRRQYKGLRFDGTGSGLLEGVTVEDGELAIEHHSSGSLKLINCRLVRNEQGYSGVISSHVDMERTEIADNLEYGVVLNEASAWLRGCEIENNKAAGLVVAAVDTFAAADVARCDLVGNAGRNVRIDNNGGRLTLTIRESNFGDDEVHVDFARCDETGRGDCAPDCTRIDLSDNYWGFRADTADQITDRMQGWFGCMYEMAGWQPGVDWSNQSWPLTPPWP